MNTHARTTLHAYPVGVPALCLAVGIVLGDLTGISFTLAWALSLLCLLPALHPVQSRWALPLLLILSGSARLQLQTQPLSPKDLRRMELHEPTLVTLKGRLLEKPETLRSQTGGRVALRTRCHLEVSELLRDNGSWQPAMGNVLVSAWGSPQGTYRAGDVVTLEGLLRPPPPPELPGLFDYPSYLRRKGIYFELQNEAPQDWKLLENTSPKRDGWADRFLSWGRTTLVRGLPEEDEIVHLLWAMVLGWKQGMSDELQDPFVRSGTMHVFAISGLHIALIAGLFIQSLMLLGIPREAAGVTALPLVWVYTALTGWQASAIRSAVMMSVVSIGWALRRPGRLVNSLAAAAILVLLWDPQQLFQGGFQLSFLVVFSLATLAPRIQAVAETAFQGTLLVPPAHQTLWYRRRERWMRGLIQSLSVALAAWLGSLPLVMHSFHVFNPISLLANLVVVPLSTIALASSVGSLACGDLLPGVGGLLNHSSWFWMKLMVDASQWAAAVPGGCWNCASPGWTGAAAYALALITWMNRADLSGRALHCARGLTALLFSAWLGLRLLDASTQTIHLLPRPGGAALWVEEAWFGDHWLVDPGSERAVQRSILPFLKASGINHIEHLILSQGIQSAVGGAAVLEEELPATWRYLAQARFRSSAIQSWLKEATTQRKDIQRLFAGVHAGPWVMLHPPPGHNSRSADDTPLIMKGTWGKRTLLWLPPLNLAGQEALLRSGSDLKAEILIAGIPAKDRALVPPLLTAINPACLILIDDTSPKTRRAVESQMVRFQTPGRWVLRTSETGALTLRGEKETIQSQNFGPLHEGSDLRKLRETSGKEKTEYTPNESPEWPLRADQEPSPH